MNNSQRLRLMILYGCEDSSHVMVSLEIYISCQKLITEIWQPITSSWYVWLSEYLRANVSSTIHSFYRHSDHWSLILSPILLKKIRRCIYKMLEYLKYHFGKMNLWPVEHFFEHICHHFWVGLLLPPPKSDDKYAQKFRSDLLQNPYFSS